MMSTDGDHSVTEEMNKKGVENFLWMMTMLPDFQLIY